MDQLPPEVITVTGGGTVSDIVGPVSDNNGAWVFEFLVTLPMDVSVAINVAENALEGILGKPSAASNTFMAKFDTQGPQVSSCFVVVVVAVAAPAAGLLLCFVERIDSLLNRDTNQFSLIHSYT